MADESSDHSKMLSNRLGQAIINGELEHVRMYIERGADVNRPSYSEMHMEEMYPLALACWPGHEEVMEELLKAGAYPNQVSGCPPRAAIFRTYGALNLSMMRCWISYGGDVNLRNDQGQTILQILVYFGLNDTEDNNLSAAKLLLQNGASLYARDVDGYEACRYDNIGLDELFIAEGDVNSDFGDISMLRGAADSCNIDIFDLLVNAGANRHLPPDALINPCVTNDFAMVAKILDTCDVDINMPLDRRSGLTILHYACVADSITSETVRFLLDRGADVRAVSDTGDTALHYLAETCDCTKIRQLLSYNPPLNIRNNTNQTHLFKRSQSLINHFSLSRQQAGAHYVPLSVTLFQTGLLAFKMLVTADANVTADVEHNLNLFRIKHPDAHIGLPDYEIRSTRSLKEMCRFVIRRTISVPVDVSLCKLPIPKLLQEYLNFPEFDQLLDEYNTHC